MKRNIGGPAIAALALFGLLSMRCYSQQNMVPSSSSVYIDDARRMLDSALEAGQAFTMLTELTGRIGGRLSGSPQAARAVEWAQGVMRSAGLERVRQQKVMVPHWERGRTTEARLIVGGDTTIELHACALGGSVPTPDGGVEGPVVQVGSLEEAEKLDARGHGAIVFFNRPMNPALVNTFDAYGGAVDQRVGGASAAARSGAVAVLVRSITTSHDTVPHTGMLYYDDHAPRIPAAAISTRDADHLGAMLDSGVDVRARLTLDCRTLPDAESANVIGELTGTEYPEEVIVIGGHLDSWDLGQGAHDDGAGCVQAIEALRLLKSLGLRPKRTIRVVLFMNEENGLRGATAYAESVGAERHIAAIESDRGGFAPRGFNVDGDSTRLARLEHWAPLFESMGIDWFRQGGSGADVEPLKGHGALAIGLVPESQRYFDYHHSAKDTIDAVNPRELELGAAAMALLAWLLAQEGA